MSKKVCLAAFTGANPEQGEYAEYINAYTDEEDGGVEITIRGKDGEPHSIELTLNEFTEFVEEAAKKLEEIQNS